MGFRVTLGEGCRANLPSKLPPRAFCFQLLFGLPNPGNLKGSTGELGLFRVEGLGFRVFSGTKEGTLRRGSLGIYLGVIWVNKINSLKGSSGT